jgi:predicted transcriptional regulator
MRTLVDIPDNQIRELAELCEQVNRPRAALIRDAIADYLARHRHHAEQDAFGLWGTDGPDGLAYQQKAREEW